MLGNTLTRDHHRLTATLVVLATAGLTNGVPAASNNAEPPRNMAAWFAIGAIALFWTVLAIAAL